MLITANAVRDVMICNQGIDDFEDQIAAIYNASVWIDYDGDVHVEGRSTCLTNDELISLYYSLK